MRYFCGQLVPEIAKKIWNEVKKGTKSLNSEIMLKNLFRRQRQRMELMAELEDKTNARFPDGYKRVSTLRAIAAEVQKLEVGEQWMRGKCGNMPSVHQLEDGPEELPPMAKELLQFDLDNETATIRNYRQRIRQADALGEFSLSEVLRQIIIQEQDHAIDLATALGIDVPREAH